MADYASVKKSKLSFKNDSAGVKKKKKSSTSAGSKISAQVTSAPKRPDLSHIPEEGWMVCRELGDIGGPVMLLFLSDHGMVALTENPAKKEVALTSVDGSTAVDQAEPSSVQQVLIATRLPATSGSADASSPVYSLKSANDRYLSCDKIGCLSLDRVAVGPQEEWTPIARPDGFAFQSAAYQTFLRVQDGNVVRADSTEIGFRECFHVKCQAAEYKKRKLQEFKVEKKQKLENVVNLEVEGVRRYQAWGMNRLILPQEERSGLKKAQLEGNLNETLLDRREKIKSDKYCK